MRVESLDIKNLEYYKQLFIDESKKCDVLFCEMLKNNTPTNRERYRKSYSIKCNIKEILKNVNKF